ncbi:MAG: hypothetical protein O9267_14470 [Flavobacterium sp.]|uniref:hypothetical protein n=1 Tax=Flavobacterium sp. TaxID=239 RepID=UPI0022BCA8EB|nr:hypothetical protein [Flavobacterium sp.]MCZ8198802.1 hypothetical protein [Flavobacterium sp.]
MNQHQFYLITELLISLIGGFLLLSIWLVVQNKFKQKLTSEIAIKRFDKGLLFISYSVFVWSFSSLLILVFNNFNTNNWIILISQNMFSILNSMFLILALYYFDNSPEYLYNNKKSTKRILFFFVGLSIISLLIALFFGETINTYGIRFNTIPDLLLSAILTWFLILSLYRTFYNRKMKSVATIAVSSIIILFITQVPYVFNFENYSFAIDLAKLIAKTTLIFVFLVLGTSWVLELSQLPEATTMKINFVNWNVIELSIPSKNIVNQTIDFGNKTTQFNNLLKFAIRRKFASEENMCIEVFNGGEILSQTYLSRIIDNINAILELEDDRRITRNDFFTFIGQAKYRLRFLPEYIEINNALLLEFTHNIDNGQYKEFV